MQPDKQDLRDLYAATVDGDRTTTMGTKVKKLHLAVNFVAHFWQHF